MNDFASKTSSTRNIFPRCTIFRTVPFTDWHLSKETAGLSLTETRTRNIEETAIISLPSMSLIKRSSVKQMQARGASDGFEKQTETNDAPEILSMCI